MPENNGKIRKNIYNDCLYPGTKIVNFDRKPEKPVKKDNPAGITSKIFAVTLSGRQAFTGQAAFTGESLIFTDISPLRGVFSSWKWRLIEDIKKKTADNWIVTVEEKTDIIGRYATQHFDFENVDRMDNKINLYRAFDLYFSMRGMGTLVLPDHLKSNDIRENKIDISQDEKGRVKYIVNWPEFTGGNRIILLCIMSAQYEPISDKYIKEMFEHMGANKQELPVTPYERLLKMMEKLSLESIL